jgi:hypothetical protein
MDLNILARTLAERMQAAIEQCDDYVLGTDGDGFKEAVEQCIAAIHSLKQSNSGMEVRK